MEYWFWPILRLLAGLITVLGNGGVRAVLAENLVLKQQLLVMRRSRRRAPNLRTSDRVLFGFCAQFLSPRRLLRTAIILKPATLLRFHRGLKDFKYRFCYLSLANCYSRSNWQFEQAVAVGLPGVIA
jgi:putative transposase